MLPVKGDQSKSNEKVTVQTAPTIDLDSQSDGPGKENLTTLE